MINSGLDELLNQFGSQLGIGGGQQLTCFPIDDVVRKNLAVEVLSRNDQLVNCGFLHVANMLCSDAAAFLDDHFASKLDIENSRLTTQAIRHKTHLDFLVG